MSTYIYFFHILLSFFLIILMNFILLPSHYIMHDGCISIVSEYIEILVKDKYIQEEYTLIKHTAKGQCMEISYVKFCLIFYTLEMYRLFYMFITFVQM